MESSKIDISELWGLIMRMLDSFRELVRVSCSRDRRMDHLSAVQLRVILLLANRSPDSMKLKELAQELHVTPGAVSQTVDGLFRQGFIERKEDPKDRRAVAIRLAALGRKNVNIAREKIKGVLIDCLQKIQPSDTEQGMVFLRQLQKNVQEYQKNYALEEERENSQPQKS